MEKTKYDAVLCYEPLINEDKRSLAYSGQSGTDSYGVGSADYIDPELYTQFAFGNTVQSQLNNLGDGFSAEVTDFKRWVVVKINHHNTVTGRTGSKTFLIVFKKKGDGLVFSTSNKWRTISGASQAVSYIRSAANALKSETGQKI